MQTLHCIYCCICTCADMAKEQMRTVCRNTFIIYVYYTDMVWYGSYGTQFAHTHRSTCVNSHVCGGSLGVCVCPCTRVCACGVPEWQPFSLDCVGLDSIPSTTGTSAHVWVATTFSHSSSLHINQSVRDLQVRLHMLCVYACAYPCLCTCTTWAWNLCSRVITYNYIYVFTMWSCSFCDKLMQMHLWTDSQVPLPSSCET